MATLDTTRSYGRLKSRLGRRLANEVADDDTTIPDDLTVTGDLNVGATLAVSGAAALLSTLDVTGAVVFSSTFQTGGLTVIGTSNFQDGITMSDSANFVLGSAAGTKIGTATSQLLGFWNATPVDRPAAYTQTYSTADRTHANPTAATLTVTDGAGTNDNTIGAITADASVIAAVQEIADEINKLVADVADVKQLVNSVIDDLQEIGLVG